MVSAHAYPTFELSDAVPLLAKTVAKERTAGAVSGNPLLSGYPLPYLSPALSGICHWFRTSIGGTEGSYVTASSAHF